MPTPDLGIVEQTIVTQTNHFRREHGLGALSGNAILRSAAVSFAKYLATSGTFSHTADGREPAERAKAAGYGYCVVAENLALNLDSRGFTSVQLATDAMEGWKASPGHRENLLRAPLTEIGVAIAKAPGEEKYLSVQLFGRPASLQYSFTITNKTDASIRYALGDTSHTIDPRIMVTHTECVSRTITFVNASLGFFSSTQPLGATYEVKPAAQFLIKQEGRKTIVESK